MRTETGRLTTVLVSLAALLFLAACGGGGGSTTSTMDGGMTGGGTPGGGMPEPMPVPTPLEPAPGLELSGHTPSPNYATSAGDTLSALLPSSSNDFAPLSSSLQRDFDADRADIVTDDYVKAISSDGNNGFHVTYSVDEVEQRVHFSAADFQAGVCSTSTCYYKETDGTGHIFWAYSDAFAQADRNMGSPHFDYFVAQGEDRDGRRTTFVYGVRTDPRSLPGGTAVYSGRAYADVFDNTQNTINPTATRTRVRARLSLTADFDQSTVDGELFGFSIQPPGESSYTRLSRGNRMEIDNGAIVEGQFTGKLTGMDSDPNAPLDESVRGYTGDILGEFYGPAAEEVAGVLNVERVEDDSVGIGWFGGQEVVTSVPSGTLTPLSVASYQDFVGSSASASQSAVTQIASDGANGFNVTYTIGSQAYQVHLEATDFGSNPNALANYYKSMGNQRFYLWDSSRSFTRNPEFQYFNINGWEVGNVGSTGRTTDFYRGRVVYGAATDASAMPSGRAIYIGRVFADRQPPNAPGSNSRSFLRGDLMLRADFDGSTVGGSVDNLQFRPGTGSWRPARTRSWTIENGSITGNALSADVTAAGVFDADMEGRFFGPDAAEVGGTIEGTGLSDNSVVWGYFGGTKQ